MNATLLYAPHESYHNLDRACLLNQFGVGPNLWSKTLVAFVAYGTVAIHDLLDASQRDESKS